MLGGVPGGLLVSLSLASVKPGPLYLAGAAGLWEPGGSALLIPPRSLSLPSFSLPLPDRISVGA